MARPFVTHHNALDRDLYLRIATELYLKRLIVGGIDRVYELGKDFRNEGVSHKHNPEFTMLEWYEAYADYEKTAHDLELLVAEIAERVLGTTVVKRGEVEIDFAPPWRRITLREAILERSGIDISEHPSREALARAIGGEPDPKEGWGKLVDGLLSRDVEPGLIAADLHLRLPGRALALRQGAPLRAGAGRALGGVCRRRRDRQLLQRAQRSRRAAAPLRAAGDGDRPRRRRGAALRRGLRRGARTGDAADRRRRGRHRPPGDDADRRLQPPRSAAVPGDENLTEAGSIARSRPFTQADRRNPALSAEAAHRAGLTLSVELRTQGRLPITKGRLPVLTRANRVRPRRGFICSSDSLSELVRSSS